MKMRMYAMAATLTGLTMIIGCTGNPSGTNNATPTPGPTASPTAAPQNVVTSWDPLPFTGFPADATLTGRLLEHGKAPRDTWTVQYRVSRTSSGTNVNEVAQSGGNGYFWFKTSQTGKSNYVYVFKGYPYAEHEVHNLLASMNSKEVTLPATLDANNPLATIDMTWDGALLKPKIGTAINYEGVKFEWPVPAACPNATYSIDIALQHDTRSYLYRSIWDPANKGGLSTNSFTWDGKINAPNPFKDRETGAILGDWNGKVASQDIAVIINFGTDKHLASNVATESWGTSRALYFNKL